MPLLPCSSKQLNLEACLLNGQSFRWRKRGLPSPPSLIGVAKNRVWELHRLDPNLIEYKVLATFDTRQGEEKRRKVDAAQLLKEYFQLDVDLEELYCQWRKRDEHFSLKVTTHPELFEGIRILAQDPLETILAFICSANNNISRISKMVERLCQLYGTPIRVEEEVFFSFPTLQQLSTHLPQMEQQLRCDGFGYRAGYITGTIKRLLELEGHQSPSTGWISSLLQMDYPSTREQLLQLPGVGPKVADCICLMALQKHEVVPVDTHVFQLTKEVYMPQHPLLKGKTVSKRMHEEIGRFYLNLFGPYAGWAQSVLFSTRLKQPLLSQKAKE